jgi:hypothetical protein
MEIFRLANRLSPPIVLPLLKSRPLSTAHPRVSLVLNPLACFPFPNSNSSHIVSDCLYSLVLIS